MALDSRKRATSIPEHRVAILRPFARFLDDIGVPIERAFRRARLPIYALENVGNFVPSHGFYALLINGARSDGIEDLGFLVGEKYGASSVDPKLTDLLRQSPTLYRGLERAIDLSNKVVTNSRMWLIHPRGGGQTLFCHRPSCDKGHPAIEQVGWFALLTMIEIVRVFLGREWKPKDIGIIPNNAASRFIREQFPTSRIRPAQPYSYFTLDNALLGLPPLSRDPDIAELSDVDIEPVANDFVGSLEQILSSYALESKLSVEFAAELCNTSKRTLQRRLSESGSRYSEILDKARFQVASRLLIDPDLKVTDVSRLLGYSDPTHFSRAFRRVAGLNPRGYRQGLTR